MSVGYSDRMRPPRAEARLGTSRAPGGRVLVAERLADSGLEILVHACDVELGLDWSREELERRIGGFDAIVVRSATRVDRDLIAHAGRLRVIGRAGVGVDNVDVEAATRRGIVVVNAPEANSLAAAEHTLALMLALARNVAEANASLASGVWDRSRLAGVELHGKTLGVLGLGRIGALVCERARSFGMRVMAFDPYVSSRRFAELAVERAERPAALYRQADFITLHLPKTPETAELVDADAFAQMRDGVRLVNTARGELVVEEALVDALEAGKVAGCALDVFSEEPCTEHPLFGRPDVVVTPHLGASTSEAQERAGTHIAEQLVAALRGGLPASAVNVPRMSARDRELVLPMLPLAEDLGRLAVGLAPGPSVDRIEVSVAGRLVSVDPSFLVIAALRGALAERGEEPVSYVNARATAEERGIEIAERRDPSAGDFAELVRVRLESDGRHVEVAGTGGGARCTPHLVEAWGQRFDLQLERHLSFFRYRDMPGMIGRVGTTFGDHGINISAAAVGREPAEGNGATSRRAVMVVSTDVSVPVTVVDAIVAIDGFDEGRTVEL